MLFFNNFWDFSQGFFWTLALIACLIAVFLIILDLFGDHKLNGWAKALWLLVLIFLPFVGTIVYLIVRGKGMAVRHRQRVDRDFAESDTYFGSAGGSSPASQIAAAQEMLKSGAISQADYDKLKESGMA